MKTEAQPRHWPRMIDGMLRWINSGCAPERLRKEIPLLGAASPGSDCRPDRHWPLLRESGSRSCSSKPPSELLKCRPHRQCRQQPRRCHFASLHDGSAMWVALMDWTEHEVVSEVLALHKTLQQFPQPTLTECHSHGQGTERIAQQTCRPLSIQQNTSTVPPFISLSLGTAPDGCSSGATWLMSSSS